MSDYQSAISGEGTDTSGPAFGPQLARAELPPPLGKLIQLRLELDGLRGLPKTDTSSKGSNTQSSYYVAFNYTTAHSEASSYVRSSMAQEGIGSLRGTVQWNEVLYLESFELGIISIVIYSSHRHPQHATSVTVGGLLQQSEHSLPPSLGV
ncbi:hypothetical protein PENSPDRAFT_174179 [Peniophora sp. CONT]|nr:hypothetical protein PENSPDRAFT_174179 [Peniophora sp. CONT]